MIKKFVKDMLTHGRAKDLLELLEGDSSFTNENITCTNLPSNENEMILMSHAIEHLTRISNNLYFQESNKSYYNFQNEFEDWIEAGAKGLEISEVEAYLKENPF